MFGGVLDLKSRGTRLMAIINVSPESFYSGSIAQGRDAVLGAANRAHSEGADLIDVGAMSTAPYKRTKITEEEETERLVRAVEWVREACPLPISADTMRSSPARGALDAGATIINDVSGLLNDQAMAGLISARHCGAILMVKEFQDTPLPVVVSPPWRRVKNLLVSAKGRAQMAGIPESQIVLDPGIGFFRNQSVVWHEWDLNVLRHLVDLTESVGPLLVSTSRKSFIGELLERPEPADRLAGSLACAIWSARQGVRIIRTHDVAATKDALRMRELLEEE